MLYFFFKQKTAYEMRISDWSSDVCSSDLMDDQPRGLVDHDQMLVLEHHVERDRLRPVMSGRRLGHVDRETLTRDSLARRIAHRDAIDPQRSGERRVWKEWVSTCRSRRYPHHLKTKNTSKKKKRKEI